MGKARNGFSFHLLAGDPDTVTRAGQVRRPALDFAGKRAVVSGASRGIGEAVARTLLDLGAVVAITSTKRAPAWTNKYPNVCHFVVDFLRQDTVNEFLGQIETFGPVDVLVNNAGIHRPEPIDGISNQTWEDIFEVNLRGPMQLMRHFGELMKRQRSGRIVNVASIAGTICRKGASAYSSSKLGLVGLTRAAAIDLAPFGVLVNAVSPGTTETDMVDRILSLEQRQAFIDRIPLSRFATPQEIANAVAFLASDLNGFITGQNLIIDGGTVIS